MTRRRKPFHRPPDGPTREPDPEHPANSSDDSADDSARRTAPQGRDAPTSVRQTAEHRFDDEALAPPPFPTSFSKAANVHVDPVVHAQLHAASPDRPPTDAEPDDNPLIMMLRDQDERDAKDQIDDDDFELRWKLELPSDLGEDADAEVEDAADFAFGEPPYHEPDHDDPDEFQHAAKFAFGEHENADPTYEDSAYGDPAYEPPVFEHPANEGPIHHEVAYEEPAHEEPAYELRGRDRDASSDPRHERYDSLLAGSAGFLEDDRELSYTSDATAQIDFLRSEIRRYQGDLERERLARTTAITAAQLAADARVEDLIRSQRHEREQLDLINRKLLDAQRSEAEARRSALIEEHRRQRANEHNQYQERIAALRESTRNINKVTSERFEQEFAEAHATRINALQSQLDEALERAEQAEADNRELRSGQHTWEKQLSDAESSLSDAQSRQRDTSAQLTRQVQELQERLARSEQRLNGERKRTSELVGNLLRESAAVASQAHNADQEIHSLRTSWANERDAVVTATLAEARAIERAAAEREAHLEATIGQLRAALHGVNSSTRGA